MPRYPDGLRELCLIWSLWIRSVLRMLPGYDLLADYDEEIVWRGALPGGRTPGM